MEPDRWRRVEELYHAALSRPSETRAAFLRETCGNDAGLLSDVESLLEQSISREGLLERGALVAAASLAGGVPLTGRRLGAYEVGEILGAGGMGEVYRARDPKLRRDVAIKILPATFTLDPDRRARFEREARVLASLNHPHIGAIYGFEETDALHALVLELVNGPTLADRIAKGPVPVAEAIAIAKQIADALDAAHEKGIVHRDLKPANIKITPDGVVKVLDFGLAKTTTPGGTEAASADGVSRPFEGTREGLIIGTAAYMSPQQARGQAVDKRADIWAFGCVLYEMLTGRAAFARETISDTIAAILERDPQWAAIPAATPAAVTRVLHRCLQKDSRRRLRDIGDARMELDEIAAANHVAETNHTPSAAWRRVAIVAVGASVVLASALIAGLVRARPNSSAARATSSMVASRLTNYNGTEASGAISPDGRSFVFVSEHAGAPDIWLRQVAGGEPARLTNDADPEQDLAFTPDGESVYFTRTEDGTPAIWEVGVLGGQPRKVVANAHSAAPSPDGRLVAYMVPDTATTESLVVRTLDGAAIRTLAANISWFPRVRPAWSPDGQRLSYPRAGLFAASNLFVVSAAGGNERQITHFMRPGEGIGQHVWLPDNQHIAVTYTSRPNRPADLGVIDLQDASLLRITTAVSDGFGMPSLSKDGSRLLATVSTNFSEVWKVPLASDDPDLNGRGAVRLLENMDAPFWTFVSHDGQWILFNSRQSGSRNLWLAPLDSTSNPRQITALPGDMITHSSLSPDGKHVAFISFASGTADVWTQNIDGSEPRQLTNDDAADSWPVWSPDGTRIVYTSARDGIPYTHVMSTDGTGNEKLIDGFFRGDWTGQPDGSGTWIVTSDGNGMVRLIDVEERSVLWETRIPGSPLPMFSPDARRISVAFQEARDHYAVHVLDSATGRGRIAARLPFNITFRAAWLNDGSALIVNRNETISHIALFDRFWQPDEQ